MHRLLPRKRLPPASPCTDPKTTVPPPADDEGEEVDAATSMANEMDL